MEAKSRKMLFQNVSGTPEGHITVIVYCTLISFLKWTHTQAHAQYDIQVSHTSVST